MTNPDRTMDIWSHIEELRRRLLLALVGLIVATLVSLLFADIVIEYLAIPIGGLENIQSIEVTENVGVFMKVALLSGVILALPFISYQAMA
ncbi:MAG TPA: twin-arginine translocase subunit TatC, partial [Longilinea sp.]|nr:twin-arginine translocase subunit TatC [Longilinea sp.]